MVVADQDETTEARQEKQGSQFFFISEIKGKRYDVAVLCWQN